MTSKIMNVPEWEKYRDQPNVLFAIGADREHYLLIAKKLKKVGKDPIDIVKYIGNAFLWAVNNDYRIKITPNKLITDIFLEFQSEYPNPTPNSPWFSVETLTKVFKEGKGPDNLKLWELLDEFCPNYTKQFKLGEEEIEDMRSVSSESLEPKMRIISKNGKIKDATPRKSEDGSESSNSEKCEEPLWGELPMQAFVDIIDILTDGKESDLAYDLIRIFGSIPFEEDLEPEPFFEYFDEKGWNVKECAEYWNKEDVQVDDYEFTGIWSKMKKKGKGVRQAFLEKWGQKESAILMKEIKTRLDFLIDESKKFQFGSDAGGAAIVYNEIGEDLEIDRPDEDGKKIIVYRYNPVQRLWKRTSPELLNTLIGETILNWGKGILREMNTLRHEIDKISDKITDEVEAKKNRDMHNAAFMLIMYYLDGGKEKEDKKTTKKGESFEKVSGSTSHRKTIKDALIGLIDQRNDGNLANNQQSIADLFNRKKFFLPVKGLIEDENKEMVPKVVEIFHLPNEKGLTWKSRPRQRDDYFTYECPFDPDLSSPEFLEVKEETTKIMKQIFFIEEELELFCTCAKLTYAGDIKKQFVVFIKGKPNSGKGTVINTIMLSLDELAMPVDKQPYLLSKSRSHEGAQPITASLQGKRFWSVNELSQYEQLNDQKVNADSGGDISAPRKNYGSPKKQRQTGRHWFTSNFFPYIAKGKKVDKALWKKRVIYFEQKSQFVSPENVDEENHMYLEDTKIKEKFESPIYMSAFFQIIMELGIYHMKEKPLWADHPMADDESVESEVISWLTKHYTPDFSIAGNQGIKEETLGNLFLKSLVVDVRDAYPIASVRSDIHNFYNSMDLKNLAKNPKAKKICVSTDRKNWLRIVPICHVTNGVMEKIHFEETDSGDSESVTSDHPSEDEEIKISEVVKRGRGRPKKEK